MRTQHHAVLPLSVLLLSRGEVSGYCVCLKGGGEVKVCKTGGAEYVSGGEPHPLPMLNPEGTVLPCGRPRGLRTQGSERGNLGKDQRGRGCWQPPPSCGFAGGGGSGHSFIRLTD